MDTSNVVKVMVPCGGSVLNDTPGFAVFEVDQPLLDRIIQLLQLACSHELSEARFTLDVEYPDGDYDFFIPELVVVPGGQIWVSALFSAYEVEAPIDTRAISIESLVAGYASASDGDLVFLGDDWIECTTGSVYDWGIEDNPLGYQVYHEGRDEYFGGYGSADVFTSKRARADLVEARGFDKGWSLNVVYPHEIFEPRIHRAA
jgi:hypothetical protein